MTALFDPIRTGTRFEIQQQHYEICAVDGNNVRYATIAGGQNHIVLRKDLELSFSSGEAKVTYMALSRTKTTPRSQVVRTELELRGGQRRYEYLSALINRFGWVWPAPEATLVIARVAEGRNEQPPGYSTVARWRNESNGDLRISNLADDFFGRGKGSKFSPDAWAIIDSMIEKYYLKREGPSIADAWDISVGELAFNSEMIAHFPARMLPSLRTIERRVSGYDPFRVAIARHGLAAAKKMFKAAGTSKEVTELLEVVLADGQLMDVLIIPSDSGGSIISTMGYRPYITIFLELSTRAAISILITSSPFSSSTVLRALRTAVIADGTHPRGRMSTLLVDNGCDYISDGLKRAGAELGINIEWAGPNCPDAKAAVERFIGKLTKYIHQLPGTVFCSPMARGDYPSEKLACLTIEQLKEYVRDFEFLHLNKTHSSTKRAPIRLWRELEQHSPVITFTMEEADRATRIPHRRQVVDGRVKLDGLSWKSHALKTWEVSIRQKNQKPFVELLVDEFDLSNVLVQTADEKKIVFKADTTRPRYCASLTMHEHKLVSADTKRKGEEDISSLGDYALEKFRYEMRARLEKAAMTSKKALKSLGRLKERPPSTIHAASASNPISDPKVVFDSSNVVPFPAHRNDRHSTDQLSKSVNASPLRAPGQFDAQDLSELLGKPLGTLAVEIAGKRWGS